MRRLPPIVLLLVVAACSRHRDMPAKVSFDSATATQSATQPLGPGDVRITSTNGTVILSLVGDSVRMQLSDSLRRSVEHALDTSSKGGIGGLITRSVSGVVGNALGFVVRIPVSEIDDVRYEDGQIRIDSGHGHGHFSTGDRGNDHSDARFSPEDGERFVAAVKARKAALGR